MNETVRINVGDAFLEGDLQVPDLPAGIVIFAHGSGSSRHSPRNRFVASQLQDAGFATLLMDLLTSEEEHEDQVTARLRFDIPFLAERVVSATAWLSNLPQVASLPVGYFGASTGAAAALIAAADRKGETFAVVSRGGRPDLAGEALPRVTAPTLLIVGGNDSAVISLNQWALAQLKSARIKELVLVPRATHLFQEPGTLEKVARLAGQWFQQGATAFASGHV